MYVYACMYVCMYPPPSLMLVVVVSQVHLLARGGSAGRPALAPRGRLREQAQGQPPSAFTEPSDRTMHILTAYPCRHLMQPFHYSRLRRHQELQLDRKRRKRDWMRKAYLLAHPEEQQVRAARPAIANDTLLNLT